MTRGLLVEFNKDTRIDPSDIFNIQLRAITDRINQLQQAGQFVSVENAMIEASALLAQFSSNIGRPIGEKHKAAHGGLPNSEWHNDNLKDIMMNLEILFEGIDDLEQSIVSSFNYIISEADRIATETRRIGSTLLDYGIYTDSISAGITYFTDSFNDSSKVDKDPNLLNLDRAEVHDGVGSLTLAPVTDQTSTRQVVNISINDSSNGFAGNNHQVGAILNAEIDAVLDSNPDTWFEYELVANEDAPLTEPLKLDLMLELEATDVINNIIIDPNNFGTKSPVVIDALETSVDGNTWTAIEPQKSALDFLRESEGDPFELSPASSQYKGKGIFPFFPRSTRYVHVVFTQYDYYPIETSSGTKIRYAIGIKDIEIHGNQYIKESEIVSTKIFAPSEIKKVSLQSSELSSLEADLATVSHFISPDDGIKWHEIQPRNVQATGGTEILNFNTIDVGSVITSAPVNSIRYKINLKRNDTKFSSTSSVLSETKSELAETFNVSDKAPLRLDLTEAPIPSSILLLDPMFGSVGNDSRKKLIGLASGEANQKFTLPWINFDRDSEQILVGGSVWSRVADLSSAAATATVYAMNYETGEFVFGDGTNGKLPVNGSKIEVNFISERIWINSNLIADLNFHTDADKSNFIVYRIGKVETVTAEVLKKGAAIHRLEHSNLVEDSEWVDDTVLTTMTDKKTYVDGSSELLDSGDYSINYSAGIVYTYTPMDADSVSYFSYSYIPRTKLDDSGWDFYSEAETYGVKKQISMSQDAYQTESIVGELAILGVKTNQFAYTNIEPGSIVITEDEAGGGRLTEEVAFVDGISELSKLIQVGDETIEEGVTSFQLKALATTGITLESEPRPEFSDKVVFDPALELTWGTTLTAPGEYAIQYSSGQVLVFTAVDADTTVSYYYSDNSVTMDGKYSVDYENGILYSYDQIYENTFVDYEYSNYEVVYNIARLISREKYYYDAEANSIVVNDNEVIDSIAQVRETGSKLIFKVLYEYVKKEEGSLSELEPYYTPFVNGYAISIIDKDSIV